MAYNPSTQQQVQARLLQISDSQAIALNVNHALEVLEQPSFIAVPESMHYAYGLMQWQARWIPLIDMGCLIEKTQVNREHNPKHALVVAYQDDTSGLQFGAIATARLPSTITVTNQQQCSLPAETRWQQLALSCIKINELPIPIVSISALFQKNHH